MAKKKLPGIEAVVKLFKDVMQRASLSSYYHVNGIMLSKNTDDHTILIVPDISLWNKLIEDSELSIQELDITKPDQAKEQLLFQYGESISEGTWDVIDLSEDLYSGKLFKISIKDHEYQIALNRDLMPLKLKKAEYDNVSYRIFSTYKKSLILAIKKRFEIPIVNQEDIENPISCGFTVLRLFHIL